MADQLADKSMTRKEANKLKASFELDLVAFYKSLEEAVFDIVEKGAKDRLSPDEIIEEVDALFAE